MVVYLRQKHVLVIGTEFLWSILPSKLNRQPDLFSSRTLPVSIPGDSMPEKYFRRASGTVVFEIDNPPAPPKATFFL